MNRHQIRDWLRSFRQPATYLGIGMCLFTLITVNYLIGKDRNDAYTAALRNGANLAQVLEGYISRAITNADNTLRFLRSSYQQDPANFDLVAWARNPIVRNELTLQIMILGRDGMMKAATYEGSIAGIDLSEREDFRVHADAKTDELFISKPVILKTQKRLAIVLSRRITAPNGDFAGVVEAAIDPGQLASFYSSLDLGRDGIASLVGFDGMIRARGGSGQSHPETVGRSIAKAEVFARYRQASSGTYWNTPGIVDSVNRLITYRVVEGLPLLAIVGLAEKDIFLNSTQNRQTYIGIATTLSIAIAIAIAFGAARERKLIAATALLTRANTWFETALDNMPHGLCMFDADGRLAVSNRLYAELYHLTPAQTAVGTPLLDVLNARIAAGSCPADANQYIADRLNETPGSEGNTVIDVLRNGRVLAVTRRSMEGGGSVAVHQDITEQYRADERIMHLAHYDSLTDLANRALFLDRLDGAILLSRTTGRRVAVHILDLDRFKEINDSLGHFIGDSLLKNIARRLREKAATGHLIARLGGDEFAILQILDPINEHDAVKLATRVQEMLHEPFDIEGHSIVAETSIGIAVAVQELEPVQLLKNADLALYRAKAEGRNTYRMFEPEMEQAAQALHALQLDLRNAVARSEFELFYQHVVDVRTQRTCGAEALLRWRHPQRGIVLPDEFIPLAEETGLIVALGEWVLRQACRDAIAWPADIKVAVNLSPAQFRKSNIVNTVTSVLAETGLPASRLEIEITESVLLDRNEANLTALHRLRALGVAVVLDDFGTGYSSLSYLSSFPFDRLKIDRSFVASLTTRSDCLAIIAAVTSLARTLNIATTAEGVETQEQLGLLHAAGCGQAQGYLFGCPAPFAEFDLNARHCASTQADAAA